MKKILHTAVIILFTASCNYLGPSNDTYRHDYEQLQKHYEKGHRLFQEGIFEESFEEFFRAEELAQKLNDKHYYGLIQYHWTNFPNRHSLEERKKDELRHLSEQHEFTALNERKFSFIILFALIFTVAALFCFFKLKKERQKRIISRKEKEITRIQDSLTKKEEEINKADSIIKELFKERFSTIDEMCNRLYQQKEIGVQVANDKNTTQFIKVLRNKTSIKDLGDIIDKYNENIITKLKQQVDINESELIFAIYSFAGLSNNAISFLVQKPLNTIYSKRYKMRKKIKSSGAADTELFLKKLG